MTPFAAATLSTIYGLQGELEGRMRDGVRCFEEASQACTDVLFGRFAESLPLVRVFATIPFGALSRRKQQIAEAMVHGKGAAAQLVEQTPVLTLFGTRGDQPAWNDRRTSKGHEVIPLASPEFIDSVPMIARLLTELGADPGRGAADPKRVAEGVLPGGLGGVFHVDDAATAVDAAGRKIIGSQDFVRDSGVRTVFGVGGTYSGGTVVAIILFTREALPRSVSHRFLPIVNHFKSLTLNYVVRGKFFPTIEK